MFSNINADKDELIQLVLVGQPELRELIAQPRLVQFAQRVAAEYHLPAMSAPAVAAYIAHRLAVAGATREIFTPAACECVHLASRRRAAAGQPDLRLCAGLRLHRRARRVDAGVIEQVVTDRPMPRQPRRWWCEAMPQPRPEATPGDLPAAAAVLPGDHRLPDGDRRHRRLHPAAGLQTLGEHAGREPADPGRPRAEHRAGQPVRAGADHRAAAHDPRQPPAARRAHRPLRRPAGDDARARSSATSASASSSSASSPTRPATPTSPAPPSSASPSRRRPQAAR